MATAAREAGPEESRKTVVPRTPQSSGQGETARGEPENVLERLAAIQTATGIPIVVVRLEFGGAKKRSVDLEIEKQTRALGIPYLDTRAGFEDTRASDFWIYELDPHPNAAAHEIFAELIADFLEAHRLLGS